MLLSQVMDQLGDAAATIPDLRAHPYYAENVTPPAAIVGWPDEYLFDTGMQRGSDRFTIPLIVVVGRADARSSRDRLAKYADGSGPESIKQVLEGWSPTPPAVKAWDSLRVESIEFGISTIAGKAYLAATFSIDIEGTGA
ncbi:hypothetical protein GCM10010472_10830 [Pseudonocardia halophobica]|uniref:Tail terminator n=1 Tax=Pseudonocardia halophobica TaxID=29401 RepID=A0A9W6L5S2_9PSEU|nr:hypothetical protein [Pseudonocardia halophobica]GLL13470.1 hypothetical protein GCM10017577_46140 [Pseudonocardia halophobica]